MRVVAIVVLCDIAVPHIVLTVPRIKLNTSCHIASNQDSEHDVVVLVSLGGLEGLDNFCTASCFFSTRATR